MCESCGNHALDEEEGLTFGQTVIAKLLRPAIIPLGAAVARSRYPHDGKKLPVIVNGLMNEMTRLIHGTTILHSVGVAQRILRRAKIIARTHCDCLFNMGSIDGTLPVGTKMDFCFAIGGQADLEINKQRAKRSSYEEAMKVITACRAQGAQLSLGWISGLKAAWICNCHANTCGSHRLPEIRYGALPSGFVAKLDESKCISCGVCENWCPHNTGLQYQPQRGVPIVDPEHCKGCGLCIENCPTKALHFGIREIGWDPRTGKTIKYSEHPSLIA